MNEFDSADFDEEMLKHLIRSAEVMDKAKELGVEANDFMSSHVAGIKLYREIAKAVMSIGEAPISRKMLELKITENCRREDLLDQEQVATLLTWCYDSPINVSHMLEQITPFVRHRRIVKVMEVNKDAPLTIQDELAKLAVQLTDNKVKLATKSASPFDVPILPTKVVCIPTGFMAIDKVIHGIARQECGLIIGHSGSGKTAVTSAMAKYAALNGYKSLYISLEEPLENISHRWYANHFRIPYTALHYGLEDGNGATKLDLQMLFAEMDPIEKETLMNLRIVDARALCPINTDGLKKILEDKAAEGFIPDVVYIDQLDYIEPKEKLKPNAADWEKYGKAAFELDLFSQYKIQGEHPFALWVIHQGKGQMKWEYGYEEIAGFKGIVKPFDACVGIGRYDRQSPYVNLFTMKVRHTQHAVQSYQAEFQYMAFNECKWSPEILKKAEKADKALERERKNPRGERKIKEYLINRKEE